MKKLGEYYDKFADLIVTYGGRVVLAIVVLIIGLWIIKWLMKKISKRMEKREVDASLRPFLTTLISALLKIMLFISVLSMIGVQMTAFIAILGAAGLAVGLALQGSLANFAGGVLILLLKPFTVDDFIDTGSYSGTVREIQIFYTYITTAQNQEVIIPNGKLSNNALTNYSFHNTRRMDISVRIGYDDDIDKTKSILEGLVTKEGRFLKDPTFDIYVEALAENTVNIHVRAWLNSSDYWAVYNEMFETIKKAFDAEGVSIPFPQRDIHIIKSE